MHFTRTVILLAAAAGLGLPLAASAQPQPAAVARSAEAVAIIEAVDQRERSVILRGEDGALTTLFLGNQVRNLPQVKAGDRVVMRVTEAVAVAMNRPDGRAPVAAGEAAGAAPPGSMPGAAYVRGLRALVTIDAVDRRANTVTFTGPQGNQRTVALRDPKMRDFARRLRAGDQVQVAVVESVTIDVVR
ncbi:hypothetical protein E2C06_27965 [Dankookia rubra]|uniref:Copper-binding protein n=1 Tax=Dankookia rubra TaxID=1442381 RepID=A0A4R5Q9U7_9PROT|nr:hypothetical protein [Dankookia rubra]TDH59309.1 hypothetical protein E2C06_27965 [Dankookia rubra]